MKYIDLTQKISSQMPVYPGTNPPTFKKACTLEEHGFRELEMNMYTHTGTHLDCPAHLAEEGLTTDEMAVDCFVGKAAIIDCTVTKANSELSSDLLKPFLEQPEKPEFLLFYTGWDKKWGQEEYFSGFPVLSKGLAEQIANFGVKGVGIDAISVEPVDAKDLPIHRILLAKKIIIVENLTNLDKLSGGLCNFSCFPLKMEGADGSPVRAVASF